MKIHNIFFLKSQQLKNNIFWKSIIVLVSGTALAQIVGLLTTPVISRLYNPKEFGEYLIILSTAAIISSIVSLGLNSAVMVPKSDEESTQVFMVSFFTMFLFSTALLILVVVISPLIQLFEWGMNYFVSCLLVYVFVVLNNLKGLLNIYVNRKKLNRVLFYNSLIGAFATLIITIPLGIFKWGSLGLITGSIVAGVISIIQMIYHANPFIKIPSVTTFKKVFKKYKEFIYYQYPSNFFGNFAIQLPAQLFSSSFGSANLGLYSMCEKVLGIPTRIVGTPINTIYFRTASEYFKEGKNLAKFTFSLITKIMLIAFIPIVIIIIWGQEIFTSILGEKWGEAGKLASILILQYVFLFCNNSTAYCRVAIGRQKVNLVVSVLNLIVVGISIFAGILIFGDFKNTILVFSLGSIFYLVIDMAINFYCMGRYVVRYIIFALIYVTIVLFIWFWTIL